MSNQESQQVSKSSLTSLLNIQALLVQTLILYKQRLITFLIIILIQFLPFIILSFFLFGFDFIYLLHQLPSHIIFLFYILPLILLFSKPFTYGFLYYFLIIFLGLFYFWGKIALLYAIKDSQEKINVIEAYRRSWYKIFPYLWLFFLTKFLIIGGLMLFIVPGIIFFVWFSIADFVLIAENLGGMDALLKSREYIRNYWYIVFFLLFFLFFLLHYYFLFSSFFLFKILSLFKISNTLYLDYFIYLFFHLFIETFKFLLYSHLKDLKKDMVFKPNYVQKIKFILVGISGFIFFLLSLYFSH